jgi:hypothetical protein
MSDSPANSAVGSRPYTEIDRTFGMHFHGAFHKKHHSASSAPNTRKMMPPFLKTLVALGKLPPTRTLENCSTNGGNYEGVMLDREDSRWAWEPMHEYQFPDKKWCSRHSDYDGSHLTVYRRILANPVTEEILRVRSKDTGSAVGDGPAKGDFGLDSGPDLDNYKAFFDCATDYSTLARPTGPWYDPKDPTVVWEPLYIGDYMDELYCKEHKQKERSVESIYRSVSGNPQKESTPESLLPSQQASGEI